jgi:hypothetical protein
MNPWDFFESQKYRDMEAAIYSLERRGHFIFDSNQVIRCVIEMNKGELIEGCKPASPRHSGKNDLHYRYSLSSDTINFSNTQIQILSHHWLEIDPITSYIIMWRTLFLPKSGTKVGEYIEKIVITPHTSHQEILESLRRGSPF